MSAVKWVILSTIVVLAVYFLFLAPQSFSEADITAMKASIKSEFEKREGVTVTEVTMFKESSNKAIGFVKMRVPILGEITKNCTATMVEGGGKYLWRCE